jgi:hypothetical protein
VNTLTFAPPEDPTVDEKEELLPQQVLADVRAGESDDFLLNKYGIDALSLRSLFQLFITTKAITLDDLGTRATVAEKTKKEETEKYQQLFLMAEAAFKNEDDRYSRLEDTAHKYVPVMLYLISAEGYFAKWVIDKLVPPKNCLDWLGTLFIVLALATLMISGGLLFRSFRFEDVRLFRPDEKVVKFFDTYDLSTIYRLYAVEFNKERDVNAQITEEKIKIRLWAYRLIVASFVFLILTGLVFVITHVH